MSIICQLGRAVLGAEHPVAVERFAGDYDAVRDAIAAVVPGCADYNTKSASPTAFSCHTRPATPASSRRATGKANFAVNPMQWVPVPPGRLILQTLRSHDQYNTTIYGLDDRYRGVKGGRRVVFVNPADIETLGLSEGARVDLVSEYTEATGEVQERRAKDFLVVPYSHRSATPPRTTPRPMPWLRWITLRPSRIHRCRRLS